MKKSFVAFSLICVVAIFACAKFDPPKFNGPASYSSSEYLSSSELNQSDVLETVDSNVDSSSILEVSSSSETSISSISSTISSSFSSIPTINSSSSSEYKFDFNYEWPEEYEGENPSYVSDNFVKDFRIRFEGARSFEDTFDCKAIVFDKTSSKYYAKTYKTLHRDQPYTYFEDVAMYYMAFNTWPENYKSSKLDAVAYGKQGRCISTYTYGSYSGSNNYTNAFGQWNNMVNGTYYELDIDVTSDNSYNTGSSIPNRGTGRLVVVKDGLHENGYGSEPVIFYTTDHYAHFNEFYNYYGGWGKDFLGAKYTNTRPNPKTLSNWVEL